MKILVTAFEPFGKRSVNASLAVMKALPDQIEADEIIKEMLPVDHELAPIQLCTLLNSVDPDAVICMGEAGGTQYVRLEHVAVNWMNFRIPDNTGKTITDERISEKGETAFFSTLPLRKFEASLESEEIPVGISMTAGTYLCNQIFYTLMEHLAGHQMDIPAGFIHLPAEIVGVDEVEPVCNLEKCVRGMYLILGDLST